MSLIPVSDIIRRAEESGARTVALQFPEGLKRKAFLVACDLKKAGFSVIINGDPCYGSCDLCLDTKEMADLLIHFGHAPVDEQAGVCYEYVHYEIDVHVIEKAISHLNGKKVGLITTIQHVHQISEMGTFLESKGIECLVGDGGGRTPFPGQVLGCSFEEAKKTGADEILFVGTGVFHPIGVQLSTGARVIAIDPYSGEVQEISASRLLRRRFLQIEKARGAESVGIILSLKSGQKRPELAKYLAALSDNAFIITMREVTPEALINLGFDCYVNTACPRLAYDDQVRFPVPLLSPAEFEIVCGVREWDEYIIDEIP